MKEIINLALRTEYSFQKTFGRVAEVFKSQEGATAIGVADINSTFAHFHLDKYCKEKEIKPIFGVRLMVVKDPKKKVPPRGQYGPEYIFIAKNYEGLKEIYALASHALNCTYYRAHCGLLDVWGLSDNVIVIAANYEMDERIDYIALCNTTSPRAKNSEIPKVAIVNNQMINADDKEVYQLFTGRHKEMFTYPTHILSTPEWFAQFGDEEAIENTHKIAEICNVEFPRAEPVRYKGDKNIRSLCRKGARKLGIDLKDAVYKARLKRELNLIKEKDFGDYFLIVSEMIYKAKKTQLVGPGRGSSGGSLVCYLLGITTVDPIQWGLFFERFIDVNRLDMPDIDIDFPDTKRQGVIDELIKDNGAENVKCVATISQMRHRGAIGDFAKSLHIPEEEVDGIKNAIIVRSSGDARYFSCMHDTFHETEVGKAFIARYPQMEYVAKIERHARHTGTHAAGVIVSTEPCVNFGTVNSKDNTVQIDKIVAEKMNLLKMDCLGLKTLTVVEDVADMAGIPYSFFYEMELDDDKVFNLFRKGRVKGIFQFAGHALEGLCKTIKVRNIEDIIAITALARPGPLHSGGAGKFARIHQGLEEIEYVMKNKEIENITKSTMGVIIYQEQVMQIMREVGGMPWDKVGGVRKAMAHKEGTNALNVFKEAFIKGAMDKGTAKEDVEAAWDKILKFAQYGFNRSHSVEYGLVSYWTAWCKRYYPLEFLIANLNHPKSLVSSKRLIREMDKYHDYELIPFDYERSEEKWTIQNGNEIVGPLTNVGGIGVKNAIVVMRKRVSGEPHAAGIQAKLENPVTDFDIIYPCDYYWGKMFRNPSRYGLYESPTTIDKINRKGDYLVVAQLMKKNVRDLNEVQNVAKRGGEVYDDNTKLLNITIEDDTASLMCRISRFEYDEIGHVVAEEGEEEKDWYLIKGRIISDEIIFLFISDIYKLGDGYSEKQTITDIRHSI